MRAPLRLFLTLVSLTSHLVAAKAPKFGPVPDKLAPAPAQNGFPAAPKISKHTVNIAGLIVNVYGIDQLTSPSPGSPAPSILGSVHLHGRKQSAVAEEPFVRSLYGAIRQYMDAGGANTLRDLLMISFDARNHGKRMTSEKEQESFNSGNPNYAVDLYATITGTRADLSYVIDWLNVYLFPSNERVIDMWAVTGRSMGGHTAWQALALEPRIRIGCPLVGMPDYSKLLAGHLQRSKLREAAPQVPAAFLDLINRTNPAQTPYTSTDPNANPFWGKKILATSGGSDKTVPYDYSRQFHIGLVLGPPTDPATADSFEVFIQPLTEHTVTPESTSARGTDTRSPRSGGPRGALAVPLGRGQHV